MDSKQEQMKRTNISSGTTWEKTLGYSRAVRVGKNIAIASTAAINRHGELVGIDSPHEQSKFILKKIANTLEAAGANLHHVIRTRIYLKDMNYWNEVGVAHAEFFGNIRPVTTIIEVKDLIMEKSLVEIEADAIIYDNNQTDESAIIKE